MTGPVMMLTPPKPPSKPKSSQFERHRLALCEGYQSLLFVQCLVRNRASITEPKQMAKRRSHSGRDAAAEEMI